MILHASIQLFSRTAPHHAAPRRTAQERIFHGVSHARSHPLGSTGVDFIRNVGEAFEGVREPPFPHDVHARVYTHQRVLRFPASEISASRCGRTHLPLSLSLSLSLSAPPFPTNSSTLFSGDCQRRGRYARTGAEQTFHVNVFLPRTSTYLRLALYHVISLTVHIAFRNLYVSSIPKYARDERTTGNATHKRVV